MPAAADRIWFSLRRKALAYTIRTPALCQHLFSSFFICPSTSFSTAISAISPTFINTTYGGRQEQPQDQIAPGDDLPVPKTAPALGKQGDGQHHPQQGAPRRSPSRPHRDQLLRRERSLLYVASSRARDQLVVTTGERPSSLLPESAMAEAAS